MKLSPILLNPFLALLVVGGLSAQSSIRVGDWRLETSTLGIREMAVSGDKVYAATGGGVLELSETAINIFTSMEGLSGSDAGAMVSDSHGNIIIGMNSPFGTIDVYAPSTGDIYTINENLTSVTALAVSGDSVFAGFIGGDVVGVLLLKYDSDSRRYFFIDTFNNFPAGVAISQVMSLAVLNDTLYAGTDVGVISANIVTSNLKDPSAWRAEDFGTLPIKNVRAIGAAGDTLLVAPSLGIYARVNGVWQDEGSFYPNWMSGRSFVTSSSGAALVASTTGVYRRHGDADWRTLNGDYRYMEDLIFDSAGSLWVGFGNEGAGVYDESENRFAKISPNTPSNRSFTSLTFSDSGVLWLGSRAGFHEFRQEGWRSYVPHPNREAVHSDPVNWNSFVADTLMIPNASIEAIEVGADGTVYLGYGGKGLVAFDPANPAGWTLYDTTDGRLSGSEGHGGSPSFVVVKDLERDAFGNIWIANGFAGAEKGHSERHLAVIDTSGGWHHWEVDDGLLNGILRGIDFDSRGRVWLAFDPGTTVKLPGGGVQVLDYGGTLSDKSDDRIYSIRSVDGLESNQVKSIAVDKDDVVWISVVGGSHRLQIPEELSNESLSRNLSSIIEIVSSHSINEIGVDVRNNKWFATATGGVKVLLSDNTWVNGAEGYNTGNSPLISDNVTSIAFDDATGDVFFATLKGLSILRTRYADPLPSLESVLTYPSPFIIPASSDLVIDNLSDGAVVKILDINGDLVRELDDEFEIKGRQGYWDGRDDNGHFVPSGIYFAFIYTVSEQVKTAKIAVIRR